MSVTLQLIGADKLRAGLGKAKSQSRPEAEAATLAAAVAIEGVMRPLVPRKTGQLQGSVTHQPNGALSWSIGPTARYALAVHEGRRPNKPMPPASSGLPFVVRRAIGKKGTKARPWLPQTMAGIDPVVRKAFAQWGLKIARVIIGG